MGAKYSYTTDEERRKIKMLFDMGVSKHEIMRITGRSNHIVKNVCEGTYEQQKEKDKLRMREIKARRKAEGNGTIEQRLDLAIAREEQKRMDIRNRIREEAEKAGAPRFEDVPIQVDAKIVPNPFSNENLMMRIADSNDYTNALLNGILNKIEMLCKELGV